MIWSSLSRYRDTGLLLIRIGLGVSFIVYGSGKFLAGRPVLSAVGSSMGILGVHLSPLVFGVLAASTELLGGLLLTIGLFFRPACLLLAWVMFMATLFHIHNGDGFAQFSHPGQLLFVFLGLLLVGPGAISIDEGRSPRKKS